MKLTQTKLFYLLGPCSKSFRKCLIRLEASIIIIIHYDLCET